jgi:PAS domain S-box-containing protein
MEQGSGCARRVDLGPQLARFLEVKGMSGSERKGIKAQWGSAPERPGPAESADFLSSFGVGDAARTTEASGAPVSPDRFAPTDFPGPSPPADDALDDATCRTRDLVAALKRLEREIDERKRAEEGLRRTKEHLESVIENSVDAIGIVDRRGRFILWNRRAAEIYGYQYDELAGKSAFDLYADPAELEEMLRRLRRDGVVREFEIKMKKRDGSTVPMDISINLLKDDDGRVTGSVCVARDLSERKRAEAELKSAKEALSLYSKELERQVKIRTSEITSILRYTPAVIYMKDADGRYTLVNHRFEELFGVRNEDIKGWRDEDVLPAEIAAQFDWTDTAVLRSRRPSQVEERIPQDGRVHTYLAVKFPIYDDCANATGVCGILSDITELKQTQTQLRRLSGSIMARQEQERAALARELHDQLGQVLTAMRMDAAWIGDRAAGSQPAVADRARSMCDLIDATIDEVRGIALRLRPGVLDNLGLIAALQWYTDDVESRTGISCVLKHGPLPKLDGLVGTAAYRIVQEALTNVVRHSQATEVEIGLQLRDGLLDLSVEDNGRGFDVRGLNGAEAIGIAGMRERAGLAGGMLEIQSEPGHGTCVSCRLPVENEQGARA